MVKRNPDGSWSVMIFEDKVHVLAQKLDGYTNQFLHTYSHGSVYILDGVPHLCHPLRLCGYKWLDQTGEHQCSTWVAVGYYCHEHEILARSRALRQGNEVRAEEAHNKIKLTEDQKHRQKYSHLSDEQYDSIFNTFDLGDLDL